MDTDIRIVLYLVFFLSCVILVGELFETEMNTPTIDQNYTSLVDVDSINKTMNQWSWFNPLTPIMSILGKIWDFVTFDISTTVAVDDPDLGGVHISTILYSMITIPTFLIFAWIIMKLIRG